MLFLDGVIMKVLLICLKTTVYLALCFLKARADSLR